MKKIIIIIFFLIVSITTAQSKYGLKIPEQSHLDSLPTVLFKPKGITTIPSSWDLSNLMPIPKNQGNQGSCVAWALGYGMKSYQERIDTQNNQIVFSPSFVFNYYKVNNNNCSEGLYFDEAFNVLINYGICEWSYMPYNLDCTIQSSYSANSNALNYKIDSFTKIYAHRDIPINDLSEVKNSISQGKPVGIAVWLDSVVANFIDDTTPNKPKYVWTNPLNDTFKGDYYHAMLCVGYDDDTREFKILNSYGPNSGNNGYLYISYDAFLNSVYEAYWSTDIINNHKYRYPSKSFNNKNNIVASDLSKINFYGWLKKGYFIKINNDIKIACTYLNKSKNLVILNLFDTTSEIERKIGSYKFKSGDVYEIKYQGKNYLLKLDKIGRAGKNIFKPAGFVSFTTN